MSLQDLQYGIKDIAQILGDVWSHIDKAMDAFYDAEPRVENGIAEANQAGMKELQKKLEEIDAKMNKGEDFLDKAWSVFDEVHTLAEKAAK